MTRGLPHISDADIIEAIGSDGSRLHHIAERLGIGCGEGALRRRLNKLVDADSIERCPRRSAVNSTYWQVKS